MSEREERSNLTLLDGTILPVRAIRPDDAPALQRLHSRCSDKSIRLRFFDHMKELSEPKAKYFAQVDGVNRFALVALDLDKEDEIVAVVRFDRETDTDKAEFSALVEDRWQGSGLGLCMTCHLIDRARERGIRCFYGLVMPENQGMLRLLRSIDLPRRERRDGGAKFVEFELVV